MNVKIETYRGFEIFFVTDSERFSYSTDTGSCQQKQSYAACKRSIDEYLKQNQNFKPFKAQSVNSGSIITITGIRKDEAFIYLDDESKSRQFSKYDEDRYIIYDGSNDKLFEEAEAKNQEIEKLLKLRNNILSNVSGKKLSEYKKELGF